MISLSVEFLHDFSFTGKANKKSDFPPSPWRIIGALLAGAYANPDEKTREKEIECIDRLCSYGNPDCILVPQAYKKKTLDTLYVEKNVGSSQESAIKEREFMEKRIKRIGKKHHGGYRVFGKIIYIWETTIDDNDYNHINNAASRIGYIGTSKDTAIVSVNNENINIQKLIDDCHYTPLVETQNGRIRLRNVDSLTIKRYNEKYEATFGSSNEKDYNIPVPEGKWDIGYLNREKRLIIIPSNKPMTWKQTKNIMNSIDSETVFPIVDSLRQYSTGKIRGIGVIGDNGVIFKDEEINTDWIGEKDFQSSPIMLQEERWLRKSTLWATTMPLLSHPDINVPIWQIKKTIPECEIVKISRKPITEAQRQVTGTRNDDLVPYHAIIKTPEVIHGPIIIDQDNGTGVLIGIEEIK